MNRRVHGKGATSQSESIFLQRAEVARLYGVSGSTITRWARLGLIPAVRTPGGHYRFPAAETRRAAARSAAGELVRLD
jgi:excisionase family DNA binding protein